MDGLRIVVNDGMNAYHEWVIAGMEQRGKNATGATMRSTQIATLGDETFAEGTYSAADHWKYVGNGRGPGQMPPVENLAAWDRTKGDNTNGWALAVNIAKRGTRDFRQKNSNIFLDAEEAWQKFDVPKIAARAADILEGAIIETSITSLRNG